MHQEHVHLQQKEVATGVDLIVILFQQPALKSSLLLILPQIVSQSRHTALLMLAQMDVKQKFVVIIVQLMD